MYTSHSACTGTSLNLPKLINFRGRERTINVPQEVGTKFKDFGILLLNDERGNRVDNITYNCHYNPEKINVNILQEWLNGKGLPPTWKVLIETLKSIDLGELAKEIEEVTV